MNHSALLTDLYELTMLQAYHDEGLHDSAVFELFVRVLPPQRRFLMLAGIEQVLDYLENLRFTTAELDWLHGSGRFRSTFLDALRDFRFTGDVHAMRAVNVHPGDGARAEHDMTEAGAELVTSKQLDGGGA